MEAKRILEEPGFTVEQSIVLFFKHVVEHGVLFMQKEIQACKDELQQSKASTQK